MTDHLDHVVDVTLGVDPAWDRQADKLPGSGPFLPSVRVPRPQHDRADFHGADTDAVVQRHAE